MQDTNFLVVATNFGMEVCLYILLFPSDNLGRFGIKLDETAYFLLNVWKITLHTNYMCFLVPQKVFGQSVAGIGNTIYLGPSHSFILTLQVSFRLLGRESSLVCIRRWTFFPLGLRICSPS